MSMQRPIRDKIPPAGSKRERDERDKRFRPKLKCPRLDFIYVDFNSPRLGDRELLALPSGEGLQLGQTNVTTAGLTKFLKALIMGHRSHSSVSLKIHPARCNLTAIVLSFSATFDNKRDEFVICSSKRSLFIQATISKGDFEPIEVYIRLEHH